MDNSRFSHQNYATSIIRPTLTGKARTHPHLFTLIRLCTSFSGRISSPSEAIDSDIEIYISIIAYKHVLCEVANKKEWGCLEISVIDETHKT